MYFERASARYPALTGGLRSTQRTLTFSRGSPPSFLPHGMWKSACSLRAARRASMVSGGICTISPSEESSGLQRLRSHKRHGTSRRSLPSTMLDLAMKPEEAFRAPLNTTKLAPVTAATTTTTTTEAQERRRQPLALRASGGGRAALTCAGLARLAAGLRLVAALLALETHQVGVGLRAEPRPDADDVLVGGVHHLLHLGKQTHTPVHCCIHHLTSGEKSFSRDRKQTFSSSHLVEAPLGNVDVAVSHLHVDPQALHHRQAVLVVPQVLDTRDTRDTNIVLRSKWMVCSGFTRK